MTMLDDLCQLEAALPQLIRARSNWQSLDINYHPPFVERLWTHWSTYRVYLHKLLPCTAAEALFHPHPWPSAMRIWEGTYEMAVGFGAGEAAPPVAATLVATVRPGGDRFVYEMTDPDAWHSVRPIGEPAMSVMLTGKPYGSRWSPGTDGKLGALDPGRQNALFDYFEQRYPLVEGRRA